MRISMSAKDQELFERSRAETGMSKAAFVKLLLAEHEQNVPTAIKYKDIIEKLGSINTSLNEILINEYIDINTKILLDESIKELVYMIKEKMQ